MHLLCLATLSYALTEQLLNFWHRLEKYTASLLFINDAYSGSIELCLKAQ